MLNTDHVSDSFIVKAYIAFGVLLSLLQLGSKIRWTKSWLSLKPNPKKRILAFLVPLENKQYSFISFFGQQNLNYWMYGSGNLILKVF